MALDSKAKRIAVVGVGRPWMRSQEVDSGHGRAWRSSVGLSYPVADFAGAVAAVSRPAGVPAWLHHGGRHTAKLRSGKAKKSGK